MKKISIHQPNYIPWLGYFYKIFLSDVFVFLDDAQYSNEGMHNWHYIKTPQGSLRLKIPVQQKLGNKISEVRTKDELRWKQKHLKAIEINYKKARFFEQIFQDLSCVIEKPYPSLSSLNSAFILFVCDKFGFKTQFVDASTLNISTSREEKVIDIVKALNGTFYYSGLGAKEYQVEQNFKNKGIDLQYIEYNAFKYHQLWNGFVSNVSVIDYLMNHGYDWNFVLEHQIIE